LLHDANLLDEASRGAVESRITDEIEADLQYALDSPFPPPEAAIQSVYGKLT